MKKILNFLKKLLNLFKKEFGAKTISEQISFPVISSLFDDSERIARSVFTPLNIKKDNSLKNNVFRTPSEIDEVSVNRLEFTNADFVKEISKKIENPERDRTYFGIAILNVHEILFSKCAVVYTPKTEPFSNPFHSDIKVGYVPKRGETLPAEIAYKIDLLSNKARFYIDPNPAVEDWTGSELL